MSDRGVRTTDEVREGIATFSAVDWARLKLVAARYSFGGAVEADELLQEALKRALEEDGRKCPRDIDLVRFLAEAMRSIAHGEREKPENRVEKQPIGFELEGAVAGDVVDPPDPSPNAEEKLGEAHESAALKASLLLLFIDDPLAREIVEGIWAGLTAEELRELTGLSKTAYDSKRKFMRRRIVKKSPNGWTL